ncbi:TOM1-like protein 5 [Cajanus cajan]|uniref:TOM1-like protein 5 n=1 Tax=Cajanus cajan TaxID=3821 RepID=UPI00098DA12A|nr:TOM1-like protein 5 [Cajanus cajan]XP_020201951.1 TOM1-like protein 5 [Cajanus cajan]XP_029124943.1 TOM1-like protein 5 [Cajanus cajan]XP_029124944.1 TOM1-like protein 5 [Cajanus cajan]XP_029124945.1 TOM1-like protein 5 [Cajanus cajan]
MAAELVNVATSEKLAETDWTKNIEICELVAHDKRQARDAVKAIKKKLGSKHPNTQLYAVMLLEMLMNNIGEHIHEQVIDTGIIPILVKIVKKKSDLPVRERIFLLLDATQTSLGGASGKFPQYYNAYYDLVSAGVQFPQSDQVVQSNHPSSQPSRTSNVPNREQAAPRHEVVAQQADSQTVPESSIIQKASNALEVLKEVLDAVDAQNPQGARDEFTLDLVEQCSFQKQRVMHLVMASRDERIVSRAIELNEQLQKVLARHDDLLAGRATTTAPRFDHEEAEEEEEPEQLVRRLRKGKACARPEDEETETTDIHRMGLLGERLNRPLIRPLSLEPPSREADTRSPPVVVPPPRPKQNGEVPHVAIPPPPAKHMERERFFQENKDGSNLPGHMRGLSLHSRNGSSSHSGSFDFSD